MTFNQFFIILFVVYIVMYFNGCDHLSGGVDIWKAVEDNDAEAIKKFTKSGGDVNILRGDGSTPLWIALKNKKRNSYESLLKYGADPNIIMSGQRVVTHWAAVEEDSWWLRLALEHGADPNLVNKGSGVPIAGPPISYALSGDGYLENVKLLVTYGAIINTTHPNVWHPLAEAACSSEFEIVLYLLESGADYNNAALAGMTFLERMNDLISGQAGSRLKEDKMAVLRIKKWLEARGIEFRQALKH